MPITISQLITDTRKIDIPLVIGGKPESLSVTYYPSKVTEKTIYAALRFQSIGTDEQKFVDSFTGLNEALCDVIQYWDFFEDAEHQIMVPLTASRLEGVPVFIRTSILYNIVGDIRPEAVAPQTKQ